jgi:hypothetical protein
MLQCLCAVLGFPFAKLTSLAAEIVGATEGQERIFPSSSTVLQEEPADTYLYVYASSTWKSFHFGSGRKYERAYTEPSQDLSEGELDLLVASHLYVRPAQPRDGLKDTP